MHQAEAQRVSGGKAFEELHPLWVRLTSRLGQHVYCNFVTGELTMAFVPRPPAVTGAQSPDVAENVYESINKLRSYYCDRIHRCTSSLD